MSNHLKRPYQYKELEIVWFNPKLSLINILIKLTNKKLRVINENKILF